jgi:Phosphotransferase enzyme family
VDLGHDVAVTVDPGQSAGAERRHTVTAARGAGDGEPEELLAGDGVTRVVRVGTTVRRTSRPYTATVHAYLRHVRDAGFLDVPEPLGWDEQGREVLSFVEGDVPDNPLPDEATTVDVLVALAGLVRRLHDAAEGWTPPPDARWGNIPGIPPAGVVAMFETPELVSHQDYCPGNVVFRDGLPAALIDFDLARPTTRVADVVNAVHWWAPLRPPDDRAPALVRADIPARVRAFADAYGMTAEQRAQLVPLAIRRARNSPLIMRAAAEVDPVFRRWWDAGLEPRLRRAEAWLVTEAPAVEKALR